MAARRQFFTGLVNAIAKSYKESVGNSLKRYGLRYDDVLNEALPSVQEALSRLPPEEKIARDRRLKRALDLSFKKKTMPEELQKYDPFQDYLHDQKVAAQKERDEREILNNY